MKFDKKINELMAKGKISDEEAALLKKSLQDNVARAKEIQFHSQFSYKYMAVAVAGNVLLGLCWMILTNDPAVSQTVADTSSQTIQNVSEILNQSGKVGEMNKSLSTLVSIALISLPLIGSLIWFALCYNGLVNKEENVLASWAQVESNYQRRADLIPNLVSSVRTYIEHENQTMTDVTRLRSQADTVVQENAKVQEIGKDAITHLNDDAYMASLAKAQQNLGGQVRNLMLAVESYPTLRSSDQFIQLQAQLEGTENRINVARMAFNEAVGQFNSSIRKMPGSLIAGLGNFQRKAYFKADEDAAHAPKLSFDNAGSTAEEPPEGTEE